jgi:hypothetical protein
MLSSPTALQFLPNGDLLVVDLLGNYVARFDENGNAGLPFAFIPPAIPDPLPPGANIPSNSPSDIDFDEDGNILISVLGLTNPPDNRGAILRYGLDGTPLESLAENLEPVGSIAWAPSARTLAGDYDGDEDVDVDDYAEWKADFGKWVAAGNGADGNGNGVVDAADYVVWRDQLPLELASAAGVPEPTSAALAFFGITFALATRRRATPSRRPDRRTL